MEQRGLSSLDEESKDDKIDKKATMEIELADVVLVRKNEMEEWKRR